METNHNTTNTTKMRGLGQRFLLRLLVVAMIAAACSLANALPADAAQRQRPNRNVATSTIQNRPTPPTTQAPPQGPAQPAPTRPAPTRPTPNPAPVRDDRAQLQPDALEFIATTALPAQIEFRQLFRGNLAHLFAAAPTYAEPVVVANRQLTIDRTIEYELEPGVCKSADNRRTLGDLCFTVDTTAKITAESAAHIAEIRQQLAKARSTDEVVPGVSVAQAQKLSDIDLLELSLNSGPRSINRSSTMPLTANGSLVALDPNDPVVASTFSTFGNATQFEAPTGVFTDDLGATAPFDFDTEYFLTGFTIYRSYSDEWTYEKDAWWHPRIFISFSYSLNAGFGVRAPFSIDVDYVSGNVDETVVAVSVDPVSLDVAAEQVGLPSDAYFDGKEFVLELNFDCELTASVAGIGGSVECDDLYSIDTNFSRDFNPVIGSETRNIENWFLWEDGESPLRKELAGGAIYGEVNLGIGADVVNGAVGVQIDAAANTDISGVVEGDTTWFDSRSAQYVTVERDSQIGGAGFEVSEPEYRFSVAVRPKVKFTAGIDTAVYDNSWSFIAPLDFLGFSLGFGLDHHDGTVESHDYQIYTGLVGEAPLTVGDAQVFAP